MTKNPPNPDATPSGTESDRADALAAFGFDDPAESWLGGVAAAESPTRLGELGSYQLLSEIGRGGEGIVYRAWDHTRRREVALKRLVAGRFSEENSRQRLISEVAILSRLDHPGIVRAHGLEWIEDTPALVLEWIDGVPITDGLRDRPIEDRLRAVALACDAVADAHRCGVLHCDLKPSNLILDTAGRVRVLDFGLARLFLDDPAAPSMSCGTPGYAPPERLTNDPPPLDVRVDVYALGVVLYECLVGRLPYSTTESVASLLDAVANETPIPPSRLSPTCDREIDAIVSRAIAKDRDARYSSVDALARDLRAKLEGRPISAVPNTAWYLARKFAARRRGTVAAVIAAIAVLITFAIHGEVTSRRLETERNAAIAARASEARERAIAEAVRDFALDDLVPALDPQHPLHAESLDELLDGAEDRIHERFAEMPIAEAAVLRTLAEVSRNAGRLVQSEHVLRRAHEIASKLGDDAAEVKASVAMSLGRIVGQFARRDEAIGWLTEADAYFGPREEHAVTAAIVKNDLGVYHMNGGDYLLAERCFLEALALQEIHLGRDHFHAARTMQNLAELRCLMSDPNAADSLYEEAERILRAEAGHDSPFVAEVLSHRARLLAARGDGDTAERLYREALAIQRAKLPPSHPVTARVLGLFGDFMMTRGRFEEGVEYLRERHAMMSSLVPEGSTSAADSARQLVRALLHTATALVHEKRDGAAALREEARIVAESSLGSDDPMRLAAERDARKSDTEP